MALRGTFLVGGRPAADDLVRRFVLCAAESGIDIFRMHDPLNDIDDLAVPAAAVREAGARLYAGLVYSDGPEGHDYLLQHARRLSDMGADRILLMDPAGALDPAGAGELIRKLIAAAGVPVGLYAQGPGGTALAVAIEAGALGRRPDRDRLVSGRDADDPPCGGVARPGAVRGSASTPGSTATPPGTRRARSRPRSATPLPAPRPSRRTWPCVPRSRRCRSASSPASSAACVPPGPRTGWTRCSTSCCWCARSPGIRRPPRPVGRILAGQAIRHVLHARRWTEVDGDMRSLLLGEWGHSPAPVDATALAAAERAPASTAR